MFTPESFCIEMFHLLHLTLLFCQSRLGLLTSHLHPKQLKLRKVSFYMKKSNFKMSILFYCFLLFLHSPLKRLSVPMLGEPVFGIGHAVFNEEFDLRPSATSGIVSKVHRMRNKVVMIQVPVVLLIIVYLLWRLFSIVGWFQSFTGTHIIVTFLWQTLLLMTFWISIDVLIFMVTIQFQTTCAIHAGASGGPIVNRQGEIVGVTVCNAK